MVEIFLVGFGFKISNGSMRLILLETRLSGFRDDSIVRRIGFSHWIRVESYAGGIFASLG